MEAYKIAVLAGDGIGPEITAEAIKLLQLIDERNNTQFELQHAPFGASAYLSDAEKFPYLLGASLATLVVSMLVLDRGARRADALAKRD